MESETLVHYGVRGMKWGVRKAQKEYAKLDKLKADYKKAKKAYNKSYSQAHNRAAAAYSPSKKHREANDARWDDAYKKAEAANAAQKAYKAQKKEVRKHTTIGQKIGRGAKPVGKALKIVGSLYLADLAYTGGAVTRAGTHAVKSVMNKVGDQMFDYSILDASGKVLRRYN